MKQTLALPYQVYKYGFLQAYQFYSLADTVHGVFTRLGGNSPPPWHSLNMGHTVGDDVHNLNTNFKLACTALGINVKHTVSCHLVHGNTVVKAKAGCTAQVLGKADAIITNQPGLCLTMRFADCTPLLFYDAVTNSIALAHAGWRGTMKNVVGAVVSAMGYHFKAKPKNIALVIGPSIGPCCYQVQDDVFQVAQTSFNNPKDFFIYNKQGLYFNMWQANVYQAYQAGLQQVILSKLCTACRTDEFFSYRAEKGKTGRFGVFLSIPA